MHKWRIIHRFASQCPPLEHDLNLRRSILTGASTFFASLLRRIHLFGQSPLANGSNGTKHRHWRSHLLAREGAPFSWGSRWNPAQDSPTTRTIRRATTRVSSCAGSQRTRRRASTWWCSTWSRWGARPGRRWGWCGVGRSAGCTACPTSGTCWPAPRRRWPPRWPGWSRCPPPGTAAHTHTHTHTHTQGSLLSGRLSQVSSPLDRLMPIHLCVHRMLVR